MNDKSREALLDAIRAAVNAAGGVWITQNQFLEESGLRQGDLHRHFPNWTTALAAAGFSFSRPNEKIDSADLLSDWALVIRKHRAIPTRAQYSLEGNYSASVFGRNLGPWVSIPELFRAFAKDMPEWADVIALLPVETQEPRAEATTPSNGPAHL